MPSLQSADCLKSQLIIDEINSRSAHCSAPVYSRGPGKLSEAGVRRGSRFPGGPVRPCPKPYRCPLDVLSAYFTDDNSSTGLVVNYLRVTTVTTQSGCKHRRVTDTRAERHVAGYSGSQAAAAAVWWRGGGVERMIPRRRAV